jgi:hypothetical protein
MKPNIKMKTLKTIILGVLLAGFLYTSDTLAGTTGNDEMNQIDRLYQEAFNGVFNDQDGAWIDSIDRRNPCCNIYNSDNQLVYMSRDKNDARLNELKKRSDLIMQTESSSYYLLSE